MGHSISFGLTAILPFILTANLRRSAALIPTFLRDKEQQRVQNHGMMTQSFQQPVDEKTRRAMFEAVEQNDHVKAYVEQQCGDLAKMLEDHKRTMEEIEVAYPGTKKAIELIGNWPEGGYPSNIRIP